MIYITIESHEDLSRAKIRLKSHLGSLSFFYAFAPPQTLLGTSKVLTLKSRKTHEVVAKVDGPGFIIDEIYKDFN